MTTTEALMDYVRKNGIKIQHIIKSTNIPQSNMYKSYQGKRTLKDNEYLSICNCLNVDPMMFYRESIGEVQANDQN